MHPDTIATLGADLPPIVAATVLLVLVAASMVMHGLRQHGRDAALPAFAAFSGLYGLRLLSQTSVARLLLGGSPLAWGHIGSTITYVIPVPVSVFVVAMLGPGWRGSLRLLRAAAVGFAVVSVPVSLALHTPDLFMAANNVFVIGVGLVVLAHVLRPRGALSHDVKVLRIAVVIFGALALAENLRSLGLLAWPHVEVYGFLVFVLSLAYGVAWRSLRAEARLAGLERELDTARRIQDSLLPRKLPDVDGLALAVRYRPMAAVGGDLYDFLAAERSCVTILVADVSGHGVPAALVASMVKLAAAGHAASSSDPAGALTAMNRALCGQLDGPFVTVGLLHIDSLRRRLAWAGAGHPPLLHLRKRDGRVEPLASTGMLMGVFPEADYANVEREIESGDRLLLCTDGLLEAADPAGDMFGEERLRAFLERHADRPAEALAETLLAELSRWRGKASGLDDDLTLVVADVL